MMNMQDEAANALRSGPGPQGAAPQGGNVPPPQQQPGPQGAPDGGLAAFAAAFQRCEQTHACTPQDRAVLEAGLPKLMQMAQMVQQILKIPGQQPPQPSAAPQPQPGQ